MKIKEALALAAEKISERWKDTPLLDAQVIYQSLSGLTKESLLASYNCEVPENLLKEFFGKVKLRVSGFPVAYITGYKEFYGRTFFTGNKTLIPRADTEIIVETALEKASALINNRIIPVYILDLCTGSGCIAITLKAELRDICRIDAADISSDAYEVFKINCQNILKDEINFLQSDLFSQISEKYHIIVTNPPYLEDSHVDEMVGNNWPEPEAALRGGSDGLDFIRKIIERAGDYLLQNGILLIEADPGQMPIIKKLLEKNFFGKIEIKKDFAGRERVIYGWKI